MVRYLIQELVRTVRERPLRATAAALLLAATTLYVCSDQSRIPVTVVGEDPAATIGLTDDVEWDEPGLRQVAAGPEDQPAESVQSGSQAQFRDPQVTTAVAEMTAEEQIRSTRVQPVSGQSTFIRPSSQPVWLTGRLLED